MRTVYRGNLVRFDASFVDSIPLVPKLGYPQYTIYNPSNNAIQSGTATSLGSGIWRVEFFVPLDAELSLDKEPDWRIEWNFVTTSNRQVNQTENYFVLDEVTLEEGGREQKFICLGDRPYLAKTVFPVEVYDLRLDIIDRVTNEVLAENIQISDMTKRTNGQFHSYEYQVPNMPVAKEYVALWTVTDQPTSTPRFSYQVISSLSIQTLAMIPEVRMLIDKFQKGMGTIQGYEDSDIYEYIKQGADVINKNHPFTNWPVQISGSPLFMFGHMWIMAAAWYGLTAQHLCEGDMAFNFCIDPETLLPTNKGLIRAKELVNDSDMYMRKDAAKNIIYPGDFKLVKEICNTFHEPVYAQTIVDELKLDRGAISLGVMFSKYGLGEFRYRDSNAECGRFLWDVPEFKNYLRDTFGMFHKTKSGFYTTDIKLAKPGTYETPQGVWMLKDKKTYKVTTEIGYPLTATKNHPFLTLNTDTCETEWKNLEDLNIGDYVAITTFAEEDSAWDVDLRENIKIVKEMNTSTTSSLYEYPEVLTKELARLFGYIVAEGNCVQNNRIGFSNTNIDILEDFKNCVYETFKYKVDMSECPMSEWGTKPLYSINLNGVELRRFFLSLGLDKSDCYSKKIPEVILKAPKAVAAEFIKGYFEGDGCFHKGKIIFSSISEKLLSDLQNLLLRFGIFSTMKIKEGEVGCVSLSSDGCRKYKETIGFLFKGKDFEYGDITYAFTETVPVELTNNLIPNLKQKLGITPHNSWYNGTQFKIGSPHNRSSSGYITWEHYEDWINEVRDSLKELDPILLERLESLSKTKFLWKKVSSIEDAGYRDVIDPSFKDGDDFLAHAFISGGLVTHNTGLSTTLDMDRTGMIESALGRMMDYLKTNLGPAKMKVYRSISGNTSVGVRQFGRYSINQQRVFNINDAGFNGLNIIQFTQKVGLLNF